MIRLNRTSHVLLCVILCLVGVFLVFAGAMFVDEAVRHFPEYGSGPRKFSDRDIVFVSVGGPAALLCGAYLLWASVVRPLVRSAKRADFRDPPDRSGPAE